MVRSAPELTEPPQQILHGSESWEVALVEVAVARKIRPKYNTVVREFC